MQPNALVSRLAWLALAGPLSGAMFTAPAAAQAAPAAPATVQPAPGAAVAPGGGPGGGPRVGEVLLKRLVLVARPQDVPEPGGAGPEIDLAGVPALNDAAGRAALAPFLGRPIDAKLVGEVRAAVAGRFTGLDRPFVRVTVPPQDVTDGVLKLVVVEGRVGRITVAGARWFPARRYLQAVRLRAGDPIDNARLRADLDWINRNPYRHASVVAAPGLQPGQTDLVIRVRERRPWALNLGFDNSGSRASGLQRVSAGMDWGDAFGRGDDLSYQVSGTPDSSKVRQHSLSYTADLPWRNALSVSVSYATSHSGGPDIDSTGVTKIVSARYAIPLAAHEGASRRLGLGFDYKSTNNDILFGGVSVFPTASEVDQFVADYVAQDADGFASLAVTLAVSPGHLSPHNNDAAFAAQQFGARAEYAYARAALLRSGRLPAGLAWSSRATAQISTATLLPSEQLAFGGGQSVRGFTDQGATRDLGLVWQNDVRSHPLDVGRPLGWPTGALTASAGWFIDAGFGQNHGRAKSSVALVSTGPALDLQITPRAVARISWGVPLIENGVSGGRLPIQFAIQTSF